MIIEYFKEHRVISGILASVLASAFVSFVVGMFAGANFGTLIDEIDWRLKLALIPWFAFVFSYYLVGVLEQEHGLKRNREVISQNYAATLYWGIIPVVLTFSGLLMPWLPNTVPPIAATVSALNTDLLRLALFFVEQNLLAGLLAMASWVGIGIMLCGVIWCARARAILNGYWGLDLYTYADVDGETEKPSTIVSSGPYSKVRHPIYAGQFWLVFGTFLVVRSVPFLVFLGMTMYLNNRRAVSEEKHLLKNSAGEYAEYKKEVQNRYVPGHL